MAAPSGGEHPVEAAPHGAEAVPHGADAAAAHGAEGAAAFPPFDASLFSHQLVWFALSFGALYWLMSRVALPRVEEVLSARAAKIKDDLDVAVATSTAAESAKAEAERATAEARAGARRIVDDMRAEMAAALAADRAKAEGELAARAETAQKRIDAARGEALSGIDTMASALARDIVAKLAPGAAR